MLDADVEAFVASSLPLPPARVLEVGAGAGELAQALRSAGHEVVAIDPTPGGPGVQPIALDALDAPAGSFDAAVAVVSLHHVEPLADSCRRLGELVQRGGVLVVDEFDVERFDERAAVWWLEHRPPHADHETRSAAEVVKELRQHCHPVATLRTALEQWFELGPVNRGPYLYRWDVPPEVRPAEEQLIATGRLPATGARFVGIARRG